jgi:hypothetical protein
MDALTPLQTLTTLMTPAMLARETAALGETPSGDCDGS